MRFEITRYSAVTTIHRNLNHSHVPAPYFLFFWNVSAKTYHSPNSKNLYSKNTSSNTLSVAQSWCTSSGRPAEFSPFQSLTQPSSPEEASTVPVMFQLTRHTWELWLSNWATIWISNFVNPPDEVNSFLLKRDATVWHTTARSSGLNTTIKRGLYPSRNVLSSCIID